MVDKREIKAIIAPMQLLTTNTKIKKGAKLGYMSFGIHLAPESLSGYNVCQSASEGCKAACLNTAGMGVYSNVQRARIAKTIFFFKQKAQFMNQLIKEIQSGIKKAEKNGMIPCFRLNLTSDLPWHKIKHNGKTILEMFPNVQFYDYTPDEDRMIEFLEKKLPKNYHLTFSRKESNDLICQAILASGGNVAIVFRGKLPKTWNGKKVVNGDDTDLRFKDGKNKVVGLIQKGRAKKDQSGFVIAA